MSFSQKKVSVIIDKDISSNEFDLSPVGLAQQLVEEFGRNTIIIEFNTPQLITCDSSSPMSECRPLVGGIALGRTTDAGLAGSLGYKATYSGSTGFVTAGHVIDFYNEGNEDMEQPVNGDVVGTVVIYDPDRSDSDYAFVETNVSIDDDIFLNGDDTYEVTGYAGVTEHTGGTFLYAMGAVSGLEWGNIDGSIPSVAMITTTIPVQTGDSGGVVFKVTSGTNVKIYGHMTEDHDGAWYTRVDHLITQHGIVPAT